MEDSLASADSSVPRVGMLATVRNRRGVVAAVEPYDEPDGRLHVVHLEYRDDSPPGKEVPLWEIEPRRSFFEPTTLPDAECEPIPSEDLDALLRAARWTALST